MAENQLSTNRTVLSTSGEEVTTDRDSPIKKIALFGLVCRFYTFHSKLEAIGITLTKYLRLSARNLGGRALDT